MTTVNCTTLFDITATGVRSNYKSSRIPFRDDTGNEIHDTGTWSRSRNQQRNWETVNQVISLRMLPEEITTPVQTNKDGVAAWTFSFAVPSIESIMINDNPVSALLHDCRSVPMILGLDESPGLEPVLDAESDEPNIWFWIDSNK